MKKNFFEVTLQTYAIAEINNLKSSQSKERLWVEYQLKNTKQPPTKNN
jgi:hypothetical protein